MRFQFWSIGKNHDPYVEAGISDFTKRISNYYPVSWKIIPVPKNAGLLTESDQKKKEGESIIKMLDEQDYIVALDEKGKSFSSTQLAAFIQHRANESSRQIIFLIGGAYGIDTAVLKRA